MQFVVSGSTYTMIYTGVSGNTVQGVQLTSGTVTLATGNETIFPVDCSGTAKIDLSFHGGWASAQSAGTFQAVDNYSSTNGVDLNVNVSSRRAQATDGGTSPALAVAARDSDITASEFTSPARRSTTSAPANSPMPIRSSWRTWRARAEWVVTTSASVLTPSEQVSHGTTANSRCGGRSARPRRTFTRPAVRRISPARRRRSHRTTSATSSMTTPARRGRAARRSTRARSSSTYSAQRRPRSTRARRQRRRPRPRTSAARTSGRPRPAPQYHHGRDLPRQRLSLHPKKCVSYVEHRSVNGHVELAEDQARY